MLFPVSRNSKWGFIDRRGKLVIPPQFDAVQIPEEPGKSSFSEGLAAACVGKCDYVYPDALAPKPGEDLPKFMHKRYEGRWGYIDGTGGMVISPRFTSASRFVNGHASVLAGERWLDSSVDERWGYIDRTGHFLIEPQFDEARDFDRGSGLAVVCLGKMGATRCGYIDLTGKFIINPQFFGAWEFTDAVARVWLTKDSVSDKPSYINRAGQVIWNGDDATGDDEHGH